MSLRTEEDTVIWRELWIAVCGGIVLEEALNLSSDRLLDDDGDDDDDVCYQAATATKHNLFIEQATCVS